ncbi:MAG TPA: EFR1 family ferrodoxin [Smithellaceae bacterium]|nr:EFR1 family ferrodoxin [Smithellaceae bacterium]HRV44052.1 EFR1 family ferrodoxin [Smithellaceae bacterium]
METRRDFIKKSVVVCAALSLPLPGAAYGQTVHRELKTRDPKRALVLCYSQSGFSARYGKLIACLLKDQGLTVELADLRRFDPKRLPDYDLILVGSPVFYYDIPENVADWLASAPKLTGIPVAAFVSFGGPEGNQHNALCHALHLLAEKEAVPVGMEAFRSIAAYPTPNWDSANQRSGEHLPDEATYNRVREFAKQIPERVKQGRAFAYSSEMALREMVRMLPLVWLNKKAISKHTVDAAKCIGCRTCVKMCPVGAIHPERQFVDRDQCLACFGCLNNCPADAVVMEYRGKRLYGFPEYLKRRKITILEPREFRSCKL